MKHIARIFKIIKNVHIWQIKNGGNRKDNGLMNAFKKELWLKLKINIKIFQIINKIKEINFKMIWWYCQMDNMENPL